MRTVGIVCEYNPFHKGHLYLIEENRRRLGGDMTTVCVMSGDYVQRGESAFFDKFTRAEAACRCGVDLVLELPLPWSLSSAEGFASGAVAILSAIGCDTIAFGSECGNLDILSRLADFARDPFACSQIYRLMDEDSSLSFAAARERTAETLLGPEAKILSNANDILAVEYLKAIKGSSREIQALAVPRKGGGHDRMDSGLYPSAMQLREMLKRGESVSAFIPCEAMNIYAKALKTGKYKNAERFEIALLSSLYRMKAEDFDKLPDAGGGAGRRLFRALQEESSIEKIAASASTKRYTLARMRRMLLCAAFGICAEDAKAEPPYLRVLAANEKGRAHLARMRGETPIPLLNRASEVRRLGPQAEKMFTVGADAHELYQLQFVTIDDRKRHEDWKTGVVLV